MSYSREHQDLFVSLVTQNKQDGYYLEIGANEPIQDSNTYLLESKFNWGGISVEIDPVLSNRFVSIRKNIHINEDATKIDYLSLLQKYNSPNNIDYLSLDCDPALISYEILTKIPFDHYKFSVITFEHDFYNYTSENPNFEVKNKSRELLNKHEYLLVASNICHKNVNICCEDWYIHPDLIDKRIIKLFDIQDFSYKESGEFLNKLQTKINERL